MESKKTFGYIYLIREREFLNKNENVYKHGKTCLSDATLILPRFIHIKTLYELHQYRKDHCHLETMTWVSYFKQFDA